MMKNVNLNTHIYIYNTVDSMVPNSYQQTFDAEGANLSMKKFQLMGVQIWVAYHDFAH